MSDEDTGKPIEPIEPITPPKAEGISMVDEAKAVRDEILKAKEELKGENDRKEKLQANDLLASSAGGHVEPELISPEEQKVKNAKEFFKGTALEKDIEKANEKE